MSELLSEQWSLLTLVTLAMAFNIHFMRAEQGESPIGSFFHKYGLYFSVVHWLVLVGAVIFLSYLYTWWFMLSLWLFPVLGLIVARILGALTQLLYILGMPIILIIVIVRLVT